MKKNIIAILILITMLCGLLTGCSAKKADNEDKITIVTTTFSSYDFVRHIIEGVDNVEVINLLKPGIDSHSYSPSPRDYITINESDLFIYVGGDMELWIEEADDTITLDDTKMFSLMDFVSLEEHMEIDGSEEHHHEEGHEHEEEHAFAEHVWTSLTNAKIIMNEITELICSIDKDNENKYIENKDKYIAEIEAVRLEIENVINNAKIKHLVFGDKMPMQYFISEFGLNVSAAYSGCSTETEPSANTISYLVDLVKTENIPVVLYIELSEGQVAKTIANEAGVEAMQIQTLHNISKNDFDNGETYVSLMKRNVDVLKKALY